MVQNNKMFIYTSLLLIIGALGQWMEEGSVDLTITRVNMLGAPGAGKTCAEHLLLNEDPPSDDVSTPIACPTVRATRVAVEDQTKWKRVTNDDLLDALAADLMASADKAQAIEIESAPNDSTNHTPSVVPVPVIPYGPAPPPDQLIVLIDSGNKDYSNQEVMETNDETRHLNQSVIEINNESATQSKGVYYNE